MNMKKTILGLFAALALVAFSACGEDDLDSESVIIDSVNEPNDFDLWLEENFRSAYNIRFLYKYEDIESDMTYNLVPAELSQSKILAKMVKYLWLEPYTEVGGLDFMRTYSPRVFLVVGSVGWNANNTYTLGTAEGGLKITLYAGNWIYNWFQLIPDEEDARGYTVEFDIDNINFYYLHTIHHEFGHILHQTKNYPTDFKLVTSGDYSATWEDLDDSDALELGFISAYATNQPDDDFVETLSFYVTLSDEEWAARMAAAGTDGATKIERKLQYVKEYMKDSWDIDLEQLRQVLARRYAEIYDIDWFD